MSVPQRQIHAAKLLARSLKVLTPLVLSAIARNESDAEIGEGLAKDIERLQELYIESGKALSSPEGAPGGVELLCSLARLIAEERTQNLSKEALSLLIDCAEQACQLIPDEVEDEQSTQMRIKVALFDPSVALHARLSALGVSAESIHHQVRLVCDSAVNLSATLAFQWSKRAGVNNAKQELFVSVLPSAMMLCEQAWAELTSEALSANSLDEADQLSELTDAITQCDMGWADKPGGISEIVSLFRATLSAHASQLCHPSWPADAKRSLHLGLMQAMEPVAIAAWASACEQIQNHVEAMTEEELSDFVKGEGSEPLGYHRVEPILDKLLIRHNLLGDIPDDIAQELVMRTRKKLVFLWGISDAACQTRLMNV